MKKLLTDYLNNKITLHISGGKIVHGILIDIGTDILVLFNGKNFLYIPVLHIHHIKNGNESESDIEQPTDSPYLEYEQEISLRKVLTAAKGMFTEIYVTSNQPLHGYISSVMNNYFVFYSPVYKSMLISLHHLKWLIPYHVNQRPYSLMSEDLPLQPAPFTLARSFDMQLEKHIGQLVIFNIGDHPHLIGKLENVRDGYIHLITAREESIFLTINHLKTVHFP